MMCQVCLGDVVVADGVVGAHEIVVAGRRRSWCPMSGKPPFVWDERCTRAAVAGRSGGRCEYCGHKATNMHHRRNASQGGRWSPANILHLCGSGTTGCHGFFTARPEMAHELGVTLRFGEDPEQIPVRTPSDLLWLTDDIAAPLPGQVR